MSTMKVMLSPRLIGPSIRTVGTSKLRFVRFFLFAPSFGLFLGFQPPYEMWLFYIKANLFALNALRKERFLAPYALRPHAGATGSPSHPAYVLKNCAFFCIFLKREKIRCAFLLADSIVHGLTLCQTPSLNYCFYLCQIGVCMSVLAENSLYVKIRDSPFFEYFKQGLVVTLR